MKAVFVEMPAFGRRRREYLDDTAFAELQYVLMKDLAAGDVMQGTGGLRKLRLIDVRRSKGRRGGLRVIYYWWDAGRQFWLFTLYAKGEVTDLTSQQRRAFKVILKTELEARRAS